MSNRGLVLNMTRFPLRGGNWNNAGNAGLAALNLNNSRANANSNIGFRPASDQISQARSGAAMAAPPVPDRKDARSSANAERPFQRCARGTQREACAAIIFPKESL
jgi:hypothetical protein